MEALKTFLDESEEQTKKKPIDMIRAMKAKPVDDDEVTIVSEKRPDKRKRVKKLKAKPQNVSKPKAKKTTEQEAGKAIDGLFAKAKQRDSISSVPKTRAASSEVLAIDDSIKSTFSEGTDPKRAKKQADFDYKAPKITRPAQKKVKLAKKNIT